MGDEKRREGNDEEGREEEWGRKRRHWPNEQPRDKASFAVLGQLEGTKLEPWLLFLNLKYYFPFSITVYSLTLFCFLSHFLSSSLWYSWLPKKRWEKATRTRCVKNYHLAKAILYLRTCANCEVKPPRTCTAVRLQLLLAAKAN